MARSTHGTFGIAKYCWGHSPLGQRAGQTFTDHTRRNNEQTIRFLLAPFSNNITEETDQGEDFFLLYRRSNVTPRNLIVCELIRKWRKK